MIARPFELGRDYPEICEWWRARDWKALPVNDLPVNGVVAEDERGKHAAMFFLVAEGSWAWMDYLVTNPAGALRSKREAIELVVTTARERIREIKASIGREPRIVTLLDNENLIEIFAGLGFHRGDGRMTTMIWGGG